MLSKLNNAAADNFEYACHQFYVHFVKKRAKMGIKMCGYICTTYSIAYCISGAMFLQHRQLSLAMLHNHEHDCHPAIFAHFLCSSGYCHGLKSLPAQSPANQQKSECDAILWRVRCTLHGLAISNPKGHSMNQETFSCNLCLCEISALVKPNAQVMSQPT